MTETHALFSVSGGKLHRPAGPFVRAGAWRPTLAACGRTLTPLNYFRTAQDAAGHVGGDLAPHLCRRCAAAPPAPDLRSPLDRLLSLPRRERYAFLALFAGASRTVRPCVDGASGLERQPSFGKAECEEPPFREFWQRRLPALGLATFEESEPRPALGLAPGSTYTEATIEPTEAGHEAREAYWALDAIPAAREDGA